MRTVKARWHAVGLITALACMGLPASTSEAKKPARLFGCQGCEQNAPIDGSPRIGSLLSKKDGVLLVAGDSCIEGLDEMVMEDAWGSWAGTKTTGGGLTVSGSILGDLLPLAVIKARGSETMTFSLTNPKHLELPMATATEAFTQQCIDHLIKVACENPQKGAKSLEGVRLVTEVYGATGVDVRAESSFGGDVTGTIPVEGAQIGVGLEVTMVGDRQIKVVSEDLLVIGYSVEPLKVQASTVAQLQQRCMEGP